MRSECVRILGHTTRMTTDNDLTTDALSSERRDLLEALATHRAFLCQAAAGLTDEQARLPATASTLSVGGLIKHVAATEQSWAAFMSGRSMGPTDDDIDWSNPDPAIVEAYEQGFVLLADETLDGVLAGYAAIASETDRLVATLDLDEAYPLPPAPWFPQGAMRSVRRTILHIVAETAQHAGHADIIRESIDGARTMG
jgi:uncharacterized damage-inducible protein DinB